jgi:hypothetical protein
MTDTQREAFEAWAEREDMSTAKGNCGWYIADSTAKAWSAWVAAQAADAGREATYGFHCRVARLLTELHGEEVLSEQQCARIFGVDLVSWREIEHTFSRGSWLAEGEAVDLSGPTTEEAISAALSRAKEQKS